MRPGRGGFTLVELIVAVVLLLVVALSLVGAARIAATSMRRATLELRAAQLIQDEVQRLRTIPVDSLANGATSRPGGQASWTVSDSVSYLRVELVLTTALLGGGSLVDTVYVYRVP